MIKRIVLIGGSAGSLQALFRILDSLRLNYPFPVLLVLHRQSNQDSMLQDLLSTRTDLIPREIEEKDPLKPGYIYICPADYHVLIEKEESFSLDVSEKENFSRPSLDVVFRSAAEVFTNRVIAVLLSGANADGAEGLLYVKELGGLSIVQDPADAAVSHMPEQALKLFKPDHILSADSIGLLLNELAG